MKTDNLAIVALDAIEIRRDGNKNQITPAGYFRAVDGRPHESKLENGWYIDSELASDLIERIAARKTEIVIDYNHASLEAGHEAPAAGWVKKFEWYAEGLFANIEWTTKAKEGIENKEFRFISPVIMYCPETGEIKNLHSLSLTNIPALDGMKAATLTNSFQLKGDNRVEEINKLLGLPPDSTDGLATLQKILAKLEVKESELAQNKLERSELEKTLGNTNILEGIEKLKENTDAPFDLLKEQAAELADLKLQMEDDKKQNQIEKIDAKIQASLEKGMFPNGKEGAFYRNAISIRDNGNLPKYLEFEELLKEKSPTPPQLSQTARLNLDGVSQHHNNSRLPSTTKSREELATLHQIMKEHKVTLESAVNIYAQRLKGGLTI